MELGPTEIAIAQQMASESKTIVQISKELKVDYWQVWNHVRSWQGTKWIITNRLNLLVKEKDQSNREQLVNEVAECISYLYDQGKQMGNKIDRARKLLND